MQLRFTKSFELEYKKSLRKQALQVKIHKQLQYSTENPTHPSLRLHKLHSEAYWSISVDKSIRILVLLEKKDLRITLVSTKMCIK